MTRIIPASLITLGLAFSLQGQTAPEDPFLMIYYNDTTTVSCRAYMTANGARRATYQWWLFGFVSGAGYMRSVVKLPVARIDAANVLIVASDYCRANPNSTLAQAATAIVAKLGPASSGD